MKSARAVDSPPQVEVEVVVAAAVAVVAAVTAVTAGVMMDAEPTRASTRSWVFAIAILATSRWTGTPSATTVLLGM